MSYIFHSISCSAIDTDRIKDVTQLDLTHPDVFIKKLVVNSLYIISMSRNYASLITMQYAYDCCC